MKPRTSTSSTQQSKLLTSMLSIQYYVIHGLCMSSYFIIKCSAPLNTVRSTTYLTTLLGKRREQIYIKTMHCWKGHCAIRNELFNKYDSCHTPQFTGYISTMSSTQRNGKHTHTLLYLNTHSTLPT